MGVDFTKKRFIIAGGGTGGHLFPALAIAETLQALGAKIHFVGSKYGLEANVLSKRQFEHTLLNIRGFSRHISIRSVFRNILFPFRFIISFIKSYFLLKDFKPHAVIGTGGYSSGLPLLSAVLLSIPTLIHEQNSFPGITTRKLASKVNIVCLATPDSAKYFDNENYVITGNPVRKSIIKINKIVGCDYFNLDPVKPTVLVMGGSQGSKPINNHLKKHYTQYLKMGVQLIWQCGESAYDNLKFIEKNGILITPFIDKVEMALGMADIVISRAGAITLAELAVCGKSMVLIPFPQAAGNHQLHNARYYEEKGAAKIVLQDQLKTGKLEKTVEELFGNPELILQMSENALSLSISDAVEKITGNLDGLLA